MQTHVEKLGYKNLPDAFFEHALLILKLHLKLRYDIEVIEFEPEEDGTLHGLSDDRVSDFNAIISNGDGRSISLRADVPPQFQIFHLLHLLGHIYQANSPSELRMNLPRIKVGESSDQDIKRHVLFEHEAARYGAYLLRECGLSKQLLQWYSDFSAADLKFLTDVYRGEHVEVPAAGTDMPAMLAQRVAEYMPRFQGSPKLESLRVASVMTWAEQFKESITGNAENGARVL